jgi:large subunit ribosomal protein L5
MLSFIEKYRKEAIPLLKSQFAFKNDLAVPRVAKIVVNMGVGRIFREEKALAEAKEVLRLVTAQEPATRKARIAIAAFKTRVGSPVGLMATLRGKRMADFLDRLIHIALPRTRDFGGIPSRSVGEKGDLTIGIREHIVFPETADVTVRQMYGLEVTVVTTAETREAGTALLKALGFPFGA